MVEEINNVQNQKPRKSKLTRASIVIVLWAPLILMVNSAFMVQDRDIGVFYIILPSVSATMCVVGLVLGIVSLVKITKSKVVMAGRWEAVVAVVAASIFLYMLAHIYVLP